MVLISGYDGGTGASPQTSHQARRAAVGARPRRDAPDARAQQPAQPHRRRDRRPAEDRPRRRHRRAARRRGVRLRDRAAGGDGLHHDARLPSEHLPGRRGHAGPAAAREVHRQAGARRQLHALHRRGDARAHGAARLPHASRRWSAAPIGSRRRKAVDHWKAQGLDFSNILYQPDVGPDGRPLLPDPAGPRPREVARHHARCSSCASRRSSAARRSSPTLPIRNVNRVVGTILGSEITQQHGAKGLPDGHDPAAISTGSAGQSFGAFMPQRHDAVARRRRQRLRRQGPVGRQDHRLSRRASATFAAEENMIIGNVALLRRDRAARPTSAAWPASASASATAASTRWSRRSATTAANT